MCVKEFGFKTVFLSDLEVENLVICVRHAAFAPYPPLIFFRYFFSPWPILTSEDIRYNMEHLLRASYSAPWGCRGEQDLVHSLRGLSLVSGRCVRN